MQKTKIIASNLLTLEMEILERFMEKHNHGTLGFNP